MAFPKTLAIIPARGGSKGIPGKNVKSLNGKNLISYTLEYVKSIFNSDDICVSTDSQNVIEIANGNGLTVPFLRPARLSTDDAGSYDVILHALDYYSSLGREYEAIAFFQPTSPFRLKKHFTEAMNLLEPEIDMVMSVAKTKSNPYYILMEENKDGFLEKFSQGDFLQRQKAPIVYEINGSIYLCRVESLRRNKSFADFKKVKKYLMEDLYSLDIDDMTDWNYAEFIIQKGLINLDQ